MEPTPEPSTEPTPTVEPTPTGHNIALRLDPTSGIGRFRAQATRLPTAGVTWVNFDISFDDPRVTLEGLPSGCFYAGTPNTVTCKANGATYNAVFDADLRRVPGRHREVNATVQVSLPGLADPVPADNTRSVLLRFHCRSGDLLG